MQKVPSQTLHQILRGRLVTCWLEPTKIRTPMRPGETQVMLLEQVQLAEHDDSRFEVPSLRL